MKLPNADQAEIAPEKIKDYLLNAGHRRGGSKAMLLLTFGYRPEEWTRLADDLRRDHLTADVALQRDTEYGRRFEIIAPLTTPVGRSLVIRSIWQIDTGSRNPRLITIYPG